MEIDRLIWRASVSISFHHSLLLPSCKNSILIEHIMCIISDQELIPIRGSKNRNGCRPTMGHSLEEYTKKYGKMRIDFEEGARRPKDPIQAGRLSSECGVQLHNEMALATRWKHYEKPEMKHVIPDILHSISVSVRNIIYS